MPKPMKRTIKPPAEEARRPFTLERFPHDLRALLAEEGRQLFAVSAGFYLAAIVRGLSSEERARAYSKGIAHRAGEVKS